MNSKYVIAEMTVGLHTIGTLEQVRIGRKQIDYIEKVLKTLKPFKEDVKYSVEGDFDALYIIEFRTKEVFNTFLNKLGTTKKTLVNGSKTLEKLNVYWEVRVED
jgi:hypothetical protein